MLHEAVHVVTLKYAGQVASIAEDVPDAQYHAGMGHLQAGDLEQARYRWERCSARLVVSLCDFEHAYS